MESTETERTTNAKTIWLEVDFLVFEKMYASIGNTPEPMDTNVSIVKIGFFWFIESNYSFRLNMVLKIGISNTSKDVGTTLLELRCSYSVIPT